MGDDATSAYLLRLGSLVSTHQPRLLRAIGTSMAGGSSSAPPGGGAQEADVIDTLTELCTFFHLPPSSAAYVGGRGCWLRSVHGILILQYVD